MTLVRTLLAVCLLIAATAGVAQQDGDVPYVGTPPQVAEAMLAMAGVGPGDYVVDLGCGDGRLVIAAAKSRGARGYGVDLDGTLVHEANRAAVSAGVQDKVKFETRNLYVTDFSQATVLTLYLFPRVNLDLRPRILRLKPGTRVVSHEFDFGNWRPDARRVIEVPDKPYGEPRSAVYLWIVPANVSGRWVWRVGGERGTGYEAAFEQKFQDVTPVSGRDGYRLENVKLAGDEITFALASGSERQHYRGRISADTISGTVTAANVAAPWSAKRIAPGVMDIEAGPEPAENKESR